jgi:hypothetical protein
MYCAGYIKGQFMTKRRYYVLKALNPIRFLLVSIIFAMMVSTLAVADLRVARFFSFIMSASALSTEDVRVDQIISEDVKQQIFSGVDIDDETFETYKQDIRDYDRDEMLIYNRLLNYQ